MNSDQKKHILIVDDEPNVTIVLADGLEKLGPGYEIDVVNCGAEALQRIENRSYSLVITDYKMPDLNGLELATAIRRISPNTQVMLMTAYGTAQLRDTVGDLELDGYIDKPFTVAQIREIVERAVGHMQPGAHPSPSPDMAPVDEAVEEQLQSLRHNTGARCVLLLSSDGYPIETVGHMSDLDISSVSALVAANFIAAAELARLLGNNTSIFKSSYHEGPDYNIYSHDINGHLLLAVIFGTESKPGAVWFYTKQVVTDLLPLVGEHFVLAGAVDMIDDLAVAIDGELDRLLLDDVRLQEEEDEEEENGHPPPPSAAAGNELMNFEEAQAAGLLPTDMWSDNQDSIS